MPVFLPQEVIRTKRDGLPLAEDAIAAFVVGISDGTISEGQAAAFAMTLYFNGMTAPECAALTRAMTGSGRVVAAAGGPTDFIDAHARHLPRAPPHETPPPVSSRP